MTIPRLMLTTALIGTLALPALAQSHVTMPGRSHHATTLRHRAAKPTGPIRPLAAPDTKPTAGAGIAAPAAAARIN